MNPVSPAPDRRPPEPRRGAWSGLWTCFGVIVLVAAWEMASRALGSVLILPGPLPVLARFFALVHTRPFRLALFNSFFRVLLGLLIAAPLGAAAGIAAALDKPRSGAFLKPLFQVISATPVMSVILIAFLWFGQERTPIFTSFLMVFPVMAANTIAGIDAVDPKLVEMAAVYALSRQERLKALYLPSIVPFIVGGLRSAFSLCWKVVVAAEVLVQPLRALGTGMQRAKAQLETPELFAWTAATVIAAALSQALLTVLLRILTARSHKGKRV